MQINTTEPRKWQTTLLKDALSLLETAVSKGASAEIDMLIQLTKRQLGMVAKLSEYEDKAVLFSNFSESLPMLVHTGSIMTSSVLEKFTSDVFGDEKAQ
jgi:uncharacterized protein (DUF2344 family)